MRTNWTRVILGGLLAGLIVNFFEYIVNGLILGNHWAAAMMALNRAPEMGAIPTAAFWVWGFLIGIYALWLYAAIRPRFGPGPKTAVIAGVVVWIPASLLAMIAPAALHLFSRRLIGASVVVGLVEIVIGTVVGAWRYKEQEVPRGASAAAR
jgi:glucan phosphoethanolaminetransferase (alkaline phosphatase superfamily)